MTTRTIKALPWMAVGALAVLGGPAPAAAQPSRPTQAPMQGVLQKLRGPSAADRKAALVQLQEQRTAIIRELMRLVASERTVRSGKPGTPLHLAIVALGEWNATEARSILMEMIDYRVDLDAGAKYPAGYEYPAAFALTKMSATDVAAEIAARLAAEDSPPRRRLLLWTLYRTLRAGGAAEVVDSALQRASGTQMERLRVAREDLKLGNQLIIQPQPPTR